MLLLASSIAVWARSFDRRNHAASVGLRSGLAQRQPAVFQTAELMSSDDATLALVAESLLDEQRAQGRAPSRDLAGEVGGLLLEVAVVRPGASHYRVLIGRSAPSEGAQSGLWDRPLALAALAAPGLDSVPKLLAERYLEKWRELGPGQRSSAAATIRRAFLDASFVRSRFLAAADALGTANAVGLLPADEVVLESALELSEQEGAGPAVDLLRGRLKALRVAPGSQ